MSVHGPEPGRAKPWKATWRDGRQRARRFATEGQALEFDALPAATKTAIAEGRAEQPRAAAAAATAVADLELPEGVFDYETRGTRYRFNAAGTTRRGFTTLTAALIEKGRFEERRGRGEVAIGRMRFEPTWERYLAYKRPRISDGAYEMLAVTGGRERTATELGVLFEAAGLQAGRVVQTAGPLRIVEATAA